VSSVAGCRAASSIYQFMTYKRLIEHETLPPMLIRNVIPLCMAQYERLFSTTRFDSALTAADYVDSVCVTLQPECVMSFSVSIVNLYSALSCSILIALNTLNLVNCAVFDICWKSPTLRDGLRR